MKYFIKIILAAFSVSAVCFSQTDTTAGTKNVNMLSKRGVYILPEKGEIAIGVDASPILSYIGSFFSNSGAGSPSFDYGSGPVNGIYLKYMLEKNMAIRAHVRCDIRNSQNILIADKSTFAYDPQRPEFVEDVTTTQSNTISFSLGVEKHRGKGRLQGIYGCEAFVSHIRYVTTYEYGNDITNEFNTPVIIASSYNGSERLIEDDDNKGFSFGARAFLGIEYFIAPKISIGGEFGYSASYGFNQNRTQVYEYWNSTQQKVSNVVKESASGGYKTFNAGIDNVDGSINLFFYF